MSETKQEIDTTNSHLVGVVGDDIALMLIGRRYTKPEALRLAAWIVVLADGSPDHGDFVALVEAIERT